MGVVFTSMLFLRRRGAGALAGDADGLGDHLIVLTLAAIDALDDPNRLGLGQITPVAMKRSLRILDSARRVVDDRAPLPCDIHGAPV